MEETFISRMGGDGIPVGHFYFGWSEDAANFMRVNKFEKVIFNGKFGDMSFLPEFAGHIKEIAVTNEDERAEGIAGLVNLQSLSLNSKAKKPLDLKNLVLLEKCFLIWDQAYAETLFNLRHLDSVYLSRYSAKNFAFIPENTSVKSLRLSAPEIVDFEGLGRLKNLENLHIQKAGKLTSFNGVSEAGSLRNIYVDIAKKVVSIKEIGKVAKLDHLMLRDVGALDVKVLNNLKLLNFLAISGMPVEPDWNELIQLPSLTEITVLVDDQHSPTEEMIRTAASGAGKMLTSLNMDGKKKQPLVRIKLEKNMQ